METLTEAQQERLDALLNHLETFPTPELIVASGDLRCPRPLDERGKKRMRMAYAGAFAFGKITSYMAVLQGVDAERDRIGRQIHDLRQRARELQETDPLAAVEPQTLAVHLSGMQEITFHFFAICVFRVRQLLPLVERATGFEAPSTHMAALDSYEPLRHYFEHLEQRAPGQLHQAEVVTEQQDDDEWRVLVGFEHDADGRVVINGQPIDVTTRGLHAVQDTVERIYRQLKPSCLGQVRKHFLRHPDGIPTPEQVPFTPLVSVDPDWESRLIE